MLIKSFIFASMLLASSAGFAAAVSEVVVDPSTVFNVIEIDNKITVFGGNAGICTSPNPNGTCDTCKTLTSLAAPASCNSKAISSATEITVTFKVDAVPTGAVLLVKNGEDNPVTIINQTPNGSIVANTPVFVTFAWGAVCDTCATAVKEIMKVGISTESSQTEFSAFKEITFKFRNGDTPAYHTDGSAGTCGSNTEGFCDFTVARGDAKVYIDNLMKPSVGPGGPSEVLWHAARIYYAPAVGAPDFRTLAPATASYVDLLIEDKTTVASGISKGFVDGLTNDQLYMFTMATVDEAGNVQYFSDPGVSAPPTYDGYLQPTEQSATPSLVVGLLDGKGCFIATAAFGSSQDPYVMILRNFRDRFLITNSFGKQFVDFYYEHSPAIADFIAKNETLRAVVRAILWPVIGVANASLAFGAGSVFMVLLVTLMSGILMWKRRKERV